MLISLTKQRLLITAVQGTGDNLTSEDEAEGFVDYVMTSLYHQDGDELKLLDAGQMLSSVEFASLTPSQVAERLLDYWSQTNKPYDIVDVRLEEDDNE